MSRTETGLRIRGWAPYAALAPALLTAIFIYFGTMAWTVWTSFTPSRLMPVDKFVGLQQYQRLMVDGRWHISATNVAIYIAVLIAVSLVVGTLLAIALDQRVHGENALRTVFLYPQGMSFVVTGLIWQWILNPAFGLQNVVRSWGWSEARLDWIATPAAIYVIAAAGVWQASGLVMAIVLSGLRGIDQTLWSAARIEGIPPWRFYLHVVVPQLRPAYITATVLLAVGGVKVYELVIAMTNGGPGIASEVPAKYVMDFLFRRANLGLAAAASTFMLITVAAIVVPWVYVEFVRRRRAPA
jgi:glucose/mannose transport system permease protein